MPQELLATDDRECVLLLVNIVERAGGVLPRVARPEHGDLVGPCDLPAIPGQEERTGDLSLDESRDRSVVVLHALEVDAQPDRAVTGVLPGVPLKPS